MRNRPRVIRTPAGLHKALAYARAKGARLALVPTMGALHAGHLALIRQAQRRADRVVVSVFVNPTQFAANEDFGNYPRTWKTDLAALAKLQVDFVWAPTVSTMYPEGFATRIVPGGPALARLEDAFRPHFFGGVCTVVAKLLLQVRPDVAMFGEKDYQQLKVVAAMVRDLNIPTKIVGVATMRENDGLALSSRNAYLSPDQRAIAPTLHRVLKDCVKQLKDGRQIGPTLTRGRDAIEQAGFVVDYLEARNADTLAPVKPNTGGPLRLLVAARLGRTRLIDNIAV
jgi:pantoate--beta-alanine ligase